MFFKKRVLHLQFKFINLKIQITNFLMMKKIFTLLISFMLMMSLGNLTAQTASVNAQTLAVQSQSDQSVTFDERSEITRPDTRAEFELGYAAGTVNTYTGFSSPAGVPTYMSGCINFTAGQMYNYVGGTLHTIEVCIPPLMSGTTPLMTNLTSFTIWIKNELNGAVVYEETVTSAVVPGAAANFQLFALGTPYTITSAPLVIGYTAGFTSTATGNRYPLAVETANAPYPESAFHSLSSTNANGHGAGATWGVNTGRGMLVYGHVTGNPLPVNDLSAISVASPSLKWVNNPTTFAVNVYNSGTASQNNYTVQVIDASNAVLATQTVTTALAAGAFANINVNYTPTTTDNLVVRGKVVLAGDGVSANDITAPITSRVSLMQPMAYCDNSVVTGVSAGVVEHQAAIGFPTASMAPFAGKQLTAIEVAFGVPASTIAAGTKVWIRSTLTGTNLYEQTFTPVDGWNTIVLNTPYELTSSDIYIGWTGTSSVQYIIGGTLNTPQNTANGGHIQFGTNAWTTMSTSGLLYNNAIIGIVGEGTAPDCNPVTNLAVNINNDCDATLTWTAPSKSGVKSTPINTNRPAEKLSRADKKSEIEAHRATIKPNVAPIGGGSKATLLSEDFDTYADLYDLPAGWTELTNGDAWWWFIDNDSWGEGYVGHSGTQWAVCAWDEDYDRDSWMITSGIPMTAGETYNVSFWVITGYEAGDGNKFEAKIAQSATTSAMTSSTISIYQNQNAYIGSWTEITYAFTPTTSGTYYIGFHDYTDALDGFDTLIDDVTVTSGGAPTPTTEYNVYRNGTLIAGPITTTTYVDTNITPNTQFEWSVAVACDGGGESALVNVTGKCTVTGGPCVQTDVEIGELTSVNGNYLPVLRYYKNSYSQFIYDAADLQGAGPVSSLSFYDSNAAVFDANNITLWLGNTTKDEFTSATTGEFVPVAQMEQVFHGTVIGTAGAGWLTIEFDNDFEYTGGNLVVAIHSSQDPYLSPGNRFYNTSTGTAHKTIQTYSDTQTIDPNNPVMYGAGYIHYLYRPDMKFDICIGTTPSGDCNPVTNLAVSTNNDCDAILTWTAPAGGGAGVPGSLGTAPFAGAGQGGGIAFDMIAASQDVTITGIDFPIGGTGARSVHAYYRPNSACGNYQSSDGWTSIGIIDVNVTEGSPATTLVELPASVIIPAGQTYGFYFAIINAGSNGIKYDAAVGGSTICGNTTTLSNSHLAIMGGHGLQNVTAPFASTVWTERNFSGVVHYTTPGGKGVSFESQPISIDEDRAQIITSTRSYTYNVYRGGTLIGTSNTTSYTDAGITLGTQYTWSVAVVCDGGGESAQVSVTGECSGNCDPVNNVEVVFDTDCVATISWDPAKGKDSKSVIHNNGPFVTHPGGGYGGADASLLAADGNSYGMNCNSAANMGIADDFTLTEPTDLETIVLYMYQTGGTTTPSTTGVYLRIWDAAPNAGGTIIWGDLTTNRFASHSWSNCYRVSSSEITTGNTRPIHAVVANINTTLAAGTYWIEFRMTGSVASGPWAVPMTNGQPTSGNAVQFGSAGAWGPCVSTSSGVQFDFSFILNGEANTADLPKYNVYRDGALIAGPITATSYADATITPGTEYEWSVAAVCDGGGESTWVSVTGTCGECNPVTNLAVDINGDCDATLTWTAPSKGGKAVLNGLEGQCLGIRQMMPKVVKNPDFHVGETVATDRLPEAYASLYPQATVPQYNLRVFADAYVGNTYTGGNYSSIVLETGAKTMVGSMPTLLTDEFPNGEDFDGTTLYRITNQGRVFSVSETGTTTLIGSIAGTANCIGLAYDWVNQDGFYFFDAVGSGSYVISLYKLSLPSLTKTLIGADAATTFRRGLALASDGSLYAITTSTSAASNLLRINPATGQSTVVGPIGFPANYGFDMVFDRTTNVLYACPIDNALLVSKLITLNTTTGASTLVYNYGLLQHAIMSTTKGDPGAQVAYNVYRNGALIAGPITATTYVDTNITPDTQFEWSVAVVCDGGGESGRVHVTGECPGGDCAPVHNVEVTFNGSCVPTITWDPAKGKGATNTPTTDLASNTTTTPSRAIIYAEGFEGTTGSALPTGWTKTSGTNWITIANGQTFEQVQDIFEAAEGTRSLGRSWYNSGNNWAFSAGFELTAGENYTISYWYSAPGYALYGERDNFEVKLGTSQAAANMTTTLHSNINNDVHEWTLFTHAFTVTTSGTYYLGFHDLTPVQEGIWIAIDDIKITGYEAPATYNVYRDGTLIAGPIEATSYVDVATQGTHTWAVTAVCPTGGESAPVSDTKTCEIIDCPAVENLTASINLDNCETTLEWTPGSKSSKDAWLKWCINDVITGRLGYSETTGEDMTAANRFTPEDMVAAGFEHGQKITKVAFGIGTQMASVNTMELIIWQGGNSTANPGNIVHQQPITNYSTFTENAMNEIVLTTPYSIDMTKDLRIGYRVVNTAGYPFGRDAGPCVIGKGDLFYCATLGGWLECSSLLSGWNFNLSLKIWIEDVTSYKIYRDGIQIAGPIVATTYVDDDVTANVQHTWAVEAICPNGGTSPQTIANGYCPKDGIETFQESVQIYPNPASSVVNIVAKDVVRVEVYNVLGQIVERLNGAVTQVNVSSFSSGVYTFRVIDINNNMSNTRVVIEK